MTRWRYLRAFALCALASLAAAPALGDEAPPVPLATWTNPGLGAGWLTLDLARQLFAGADEVKPLKGTRRRRRSIRRASSRATFSSPATSPNRWAFRLWSSS